MTSRAAATNTPRTSRSSPRAGDERFVRNVEAALERDLRREEAHAPTMLSHAARYLCLAPGAKRARPRLVRLFGRAVGADPRALRDIAVAAELMHSASLLHDDVVDEGTTRRDLPTANVRFGNSTAVLAGDLALTIALSRLAPHAGAISARAVMVVQEMTRAAMREYEARGRTDLGTTAWREIAEGKTGALFGFCGFAAATAAGDPARARRYDLAARRLGIAFQLADDLADLTEHGSDRFGDLVEQNPSFPVLRACEHSPVFARALKRAWSQPNPSRSVIARMGATVLASRAPAETIEGVRAEIDAARELLAIDQHRTEIVQVLAWAETLAEAPRPRRRG